MMLAPFLTFSQNNFYYYFNQKVYLNPVANTYNVEFVDNVNESIFTSNNFSFLAINETMYEVTGDYLSILNASNGNYLVNPLYTYFDNKVHIKNEIVLRFLDETTATQRQNIINQYNLVTVIDDPQLKVYKTANPLTVANAIYETGLVKYCQPHFVQQYTYFDVIPNDEYFVNQFYLHNTGQDINGNTGTVDADIDCPGAWDITLGAGITIAVVDEGVSPNHPDLPTSRINVINGSNFDEGDGQTSDEPFADGNGNHGNAIAGIIAASINNNEGVVGVAPESIIMPVKIDIYTESDYHMSQGISFAVAESADIISCSWGIEQENPVPNSYIAQSIIDALLSGIPIVFAIGNNANHSSNNNGYVAFPANLHIEDLIGLPDIELLAVGASDRNDEQTNYSPTDTEIDLVAPSSSDSYCNDSTEGGNIWTIDIPGENGYNPWHDFTPSTCDDAIVGTYIPSSGTNFTSYTGRMGGTSSAAPQVAGVIALMKSVNDCLTIPQINEILKVSADKVGVYDYNWNDDKPGHSKELGYGRLNAFNAVTKAQEFYNSGVDLFIKDSPEDIGIETAINPQPNPIVPSLSSFQYDSQQKYPMWLFDSPDIWVRNQADGIDNQTSESIEYESNQPAYVYVKVRNKGCEVSSGSEQVELYWSIISSTIYSWPDYWDGSITDPFLTGGFIETKTVSQQLSSPFNPYQILEFEWYPPNPLDYEDFTHTPNSFSFLAKIVATNDPITIPDQDGISFLSYVTLNNNIACKNIKVIDFSKPFSEEVSEGSSVLVSNPNSQAETYDLLFRNKLYTQPKSIFNEAEVYITLNDDLWTKWETGGFQHENIKVVDTLKRKLLVQHQEGAKLKNINLVSNEITSLSIKINFLSQLVTNKNQYQMFVVQKIAATQEIVGGSKFVIKKPLRPSFIAFAGNNLTVSSNQALTLNGTDINEDATYNWYDENGNLVNTGINYNLSPQSNTSLTLEVIADADGYKDYDELQIEIQLPQITTLSPNSASQGTSLLLTYLTENANSIYVVITPLNGSFNDTLNLDCSLSEQQIPTNTYTTGLYFISLVADGQVVDQRTFVIN